MKRWLWIAGALMVAGCANHGYRYDDDGYWTSPRSTGSVSVSVGWGGGCGGWGAYGYPYYGYGYPYGHAWSGCGYGYGYGYGFGSWYGGGGGGYWRDPYWSHPWYLPSGRTRPASDRARQLARYPADDLNGYPRYEDLAPTRRRDLGTGGVPPSVYGRSYGPTLGPAPQNGIGAGMGRSTSPGSPAPPQGLGAGRFNSNQGLSGPSRSTFDQRSNASPRSGGYSAPAPQSAPRSQPREVRDEE